MAQACGGCGRPNVDAATACLYCGAALRPRAVLPPGRRANPCWAIYLPSADPVEDAARLAALLSIAPYEARLIVRAGIPRPVRQLGDAAEAEALARRAADLGVRMIAVDEHTLETEPPVEAIDRARLEGGDVVLRAGGKDLRLPEGGLDLIVTARVAVRRERRSSRISMLAPDAGATPGLPRVVRTLRTSTDHLGVLDLYPVGAARCLRAREETTDFAGMADGTAPSALLRFRALVERVRAAAPGASFDDRFDRFDDLDPLRARRTAAAAGTTILDGVARFERYSRILWHAQRARSR